MTPAEYYEAVKRTIPAGEDHSIHFRLGLFGELGELTDIIKKHVYYDVPLPIFALREELGDVLWYAFALEPELGRWEVTTDDAEPWHNLDMLMLHFWDECEPNPVSAFMLAVDLCVSVPGLTLENVMQHNVDKLKKRYPDGFVLGGGNR